MLALCAPVIALAGWGKLADDIMFDQTFDFIERYGVYVAMGLFFVWLLIGLLDKERSYADRSSKKGR